MSPGPPVQKWPTPGPGGFGHWPDRTAPLSGKGPSSRKGRARYRRRPTRRHRAPPGSASPGKLSGPYGTPILRGGYRLRCPAQQRSQPLCQLPGESPLKDTLPALGAAQQQPVLTAHSVEPPQALRQPVFCPEAGVCSLRRRRQAAYLLCAPAQGGSIFHGDLLSVEHFA